MSSVLVVLVLLLVGLSLADLGVRGYGFIDLPLQVRFDIIEVDPVLRFGLASRIEVDVLAPVAFGRAVCWRMFSWAGAGSDGLQSMAQGQGRQSEEGG